MPEKPSTIGDLVATLWIVFVAVMFYVGYAVPNVGIMTGVASLGYLVLLAVAVVCLLMRYLASRSERGGDQTDAGQANAGR